MPVYDVTAPDGQVYEVDTGDDTATDEELISRVQSSLAPPVTVGATEGFPGMEMPRAEWQETYPGRVAGQYAEIPKQVAGGVEALGRLMSADPMTGEAIGEPGQPSDVLQALGIFAPGRLATIPVGEAARPAMETYARALQPGSVVGAMEGVPGEVLEAPIPEETVKQLGEAAATGGEILAGVPLPAFPITRGLGRLGKPSPRLDFRLAGEIAEDVADFRPAVEGIEEAGAVGRIRPRPEPEFALPGEIAEDVAKFNLPEEVARTIPEDLGFLLPKAKKAAPAPSPVQVAAREFDTALDNFRRVRAEVDTISAAGLPVPRQLMDNYNAVADAMWATANPSKFKPMTGGARRSLKHFIDQGIEARFANFEEITEPGIYAIPFRNRRVKAQPVPDLDIELLRMAEQAEQALPAQILRAIEPRKVAISAHALEHSGVLARHVPLPGQRSSVRWNIDWFDASPADWRIATTAHELTHAAQKEGFRLTPVQANELLDLIPGMETRLKKLDYSMTHMADEVMARLVELRIRSQLGGFIPPGGRKALAHFNQLLDSGQIVKGKPMPSPIDEAYSRIEGVRADPPESTKRLTEALSPENIDEIKRLEQMPEETLRAAELVMRAKAQNVISKANDLITGIDSAETRGRLTDSIISLMDTRGEVLIAHGARGRALEIIKGVAEDKRLASEIATRLARLDPSHPKYVMRVQKFLESLEHQATKAAKTKGGVDWSEAIHSAYVNSRLFGVWVNVRNAVSNTARLMIRPVTTMYRGGLDALTSTFSGAERQIFASEAFADVAGMMGGLPEAASRAWRTFRTGESIFPSTTKLEVYRKAVPGQLGKIVQKPGDAMVAGDEFYKVLSYRGKVNALVHREGKKGVKVATAELRDRIHKVALDEADATTFTNKLPFWMQTVSAWRRTTPGLRYLFPFFNTNTNVALSAMEHTPGLAYLSRAAGFQAGEVLGKGHLDLLAKQMAGLTMGTAAALTVKALSGHITGGGPLDPAAKATWMAAGNKPYSIKLPGLDPMSARDLTPIFPVLAMIGDYVDLGDQVDPGDAAVRIARTIRHEMANTPFVDNMTDLLAAYDDDTGTFAKRYVQRLAASMTVPPIVPELGDVARGGGTVQRPRREAPMLGIPESIAIRAGASDVPALRDRWGREIRRGMGPLSAIFGPAMPEADELDNEVSRLVNRGMLAIDSVVDQIKGVRLTAEQYDQYVERSGELARLRVSNAMRRGPYARMSDEARSSMIKDIFTAARKQARGELLREQKDLVKDIREQRREEVRKLKTPRAPGKALEALRNR
jgi:hypothetical protein